MRGERDAPATAAPASAGITYAGSFDDDTLKNTKIAPAQHQPKSDGENVREPAARARPRTSAATSAGSHGER